MFARPLFGLATLALFLAVYFVLSGLVEITTSISLKPAPGWGWLLFGGAASLLLGFLIWRQWPLSGAWAIGILLGVKLVIFGWTMIALGMAGRAAAKQLASS